MSAAITGAKQLILRILGGPEDNSLIPVSGESYQLTNVAEPSAPGFGLTCTIERDERGAHMRATGGELRINGSLLAAGQSTRLREGDRVELGASLYEVFQLGRFVGGQPQSRSLNEGQVGRRFEKIEKELCRQSESFDNVQKRFDDLSQQMATLINSVSDLASTNQEGSSNWQSQQIQNKAFAGTDRFDENKSEFGQIQKEQNVADASLTSLGGQSEPDNEFLASKQEEFRTESQPSIDLAQPGYTSELPVAETNVPRAELGTEVPQIESPSLNSVVGSFIETPQTAPQIPRQQLFETPALPNQAALAESPESQDSLVDKSNTGLERLLSSIDSASAPDEGASDVPDTPFEAPVSDIVSTQIDTPLGNSPEVESVVANQESILANLENTQADSLEEKSIEAEPLEAEDPQTNSENSNAKLENLFAELRERDQRTTEEPIDSAAASESRQPMEPGADNLGALENELGEKESVQEQTDQNQPIVEDPMANVNQLFERLADNDARGVQNQESQVADQEFALEVSAPEINITDESGQEQSSRSDQIEGDLGHIESSENEPNPNELRLEKMLKDLKMSGMKNKSPDSLVDTGSPVENNIPTAGLAAPTPAPADPVSQSKPTESVSDVLARMNLSPNVSEPSEVAVEVSDVASESTGHVEPVVAESQPAPSAQPAPPAERGGGGEDVQDYMNSLLQRLNGEAGLPVAPVPAASVPEAVEEPQVEVQETLKPLNPEEFVPKRVAPEKSSNMAAMRELANSTSRSALQSSEIKRKKDMANAMLLGSGGAVVGAVTSGFLSQASGDIFSYLSIGMVLVAVVCGAIYVKDNLLAGKFKPKAPKPKQQASFLDGVKEKLLKKLSRDPEVGK